MSASWVDRTATRVCILRSRPQVGPLFPEIDRGGSGRGFARSRITPSDAPGADRPLSERQGIGEQDTKAALIVPVLRALGWDVEDLEDVKLEYRRRPADNPVDYALFLLRSPRLFIEAKSLGCAAR